MKIDTVKSGLPVAEEYRWIITATLLFLSVSASLVYINAAGPVQRDGSHFLFMANNIYSGLPPYWASFETKNPFVEYLWALFYIPLAPWTGIVIASRIAEGFYIALTGLITMYSLVLCNRSFISNAAGVTTRGIYLFAIAGGLAVIFILSDWRIVDNGFNIAIYQSLPEALALLSALWLVKNTSLKVSVTLGLAVFVAWWTKQTSVVTLAFPLVVTLFWAQKLGRIRAYIVSAAVAFSVFVGCVGLFFLSLWNNGTFNYYFRGTHSFHFARAGADLTESFAKLWRLLFSRLDFPDNLALWISAGFLLLLGIFLVQWFRAHRGAGELKQFFPKLFLLAWLFGSLFQAYLPLEFFPHYFLACLVPAVICGGVFLLSCDWLRADLRGISTVILAATAFALIGYYPQYDLLHRMTESSPIYHRVARLGEIIPADKKVFIWGGLMHFHVLLERASDYPQNMWWPYIMNSMSQVERDKELRANLFDDPPDFFIEFYETYQSNLPATSVPLDNDKMKRWTGRDYKLVGGFKSSRGRYGVPVRIFKRLDS